MLIPIGTDVRPRHTPWANYALILANVLVFLVTDSHTSIFGPQAAARLTTLYALDAARPTLHQYLTYQFLHGDGWHLLGNMLFLWIFGNAVCDRMGGLPYVLFYLAGGVFAGFAFTLSAQNPIVGASGAIAAVTTAFLSLYPRIHVTMLFWMFFVFTFQVPGWILIVFKIILWDNVIAPRIDEAAYSNVAYSAHLGGYAFGFASVMVMLAIRALPRSQLDLMALWARAGRRQGWAANDLFGGPPTARPVVVEELASRPLDHVQLTPIESLREEVARRLAVRDAPAALNAYQRLMELDPTQVLSASHQIEVANTLAQARRYQEAAHAYEGFLGAYPATSEAAEVRLFLGLICSRYLHDYSRAIPHLRAARDGLRLDAQRTLAEDELCRAEEQLRPG